ncbi:MULTISPECIES: hypothetical protein [Pseudofrankia]|uniref:hypothetical protein n=1 Tax=Pseudofrankia TaxID=2994363 RepID=UPI000234C896|nr:MULTISPECIES: hypothetical protein [Pseudofrankia]OHV36988.1 hypothetical protein BCD49_17205 [Pseudofrankia sp. EUN1h]
MKGLGRSAALLGLSGAASLILTIGGPGLGIAQALDDGNGDKKDNGILNDKDKDNRDCIGRDGKDGKDGKDGGILGDRDKDDDWFKDGILDDKDRDRCAVGVGVVGVGVGGGGGAGAGGVAAGGGGMAANSTPVLPLAGAGLGAILLTVGVANRRRNQGTI